MTEEELRETFRAIDDGRSFWEHAEEAGYEPARWRESIHVLDDLTGWIEMHIEQARVLQDTGNRIGIVNAIAGYVHADVSCKAAATTPAPRRWTSASTRPPSSPRRCSSSSGSRGQPAVARSARSARSRSSPV